MSRTSNGGGVAPTAQNYFSAFLKGLGLPVTQSNLNALYGVATLEGWNDRYNPLNAIQQMPGSTAFNSVGVQRYANFDTGVQGAVQLFSGSHWAGVRAALARGNSTQDVLNAFKAAYTWDPGVQFHAGSAADGNRVIGAHGGSGSAIPVTGGQPTDDARNGLTTKTTAADFQEALGSLGGLLQSVPELKGILNQAVSGQWTEALFQQKIQQSKWYRSHNQATRELLALQVADPAEYKTKLSNENAHVQEMARQLGVTLRPSQINAITMQQLTMGGDDQALQHKIASLYNVNAQPTAQAAQYYQELRQLYEQYGQPTNFSQTQHRVQSILAGDTDINSYKQDALNKAKAMFPGLIHQLDSGLTVMDAAQPYMQSMGQILELNPQAINLSDPLIKRALQGAPQSVNAKGEAQNYLPTSISDFEQALRSDPRWQYTQNAKDTMSTALLKIGSDFGFGPDSKG